MPEGDPSGLTGRRRHHHLRGRDVGDPPRGGPKHEDLTGPHLVDHFLVELADLLAVVQQVDGEEASVRDGATTDHRQPLRARPAPDLAFEPVPDDPRPELGELIGGVATAQHVERRLECAGSQVAEGIGPVHHLG